MYLTGFIARIRSKDWLVGSLVVAEDPAEKTSMMEVMYDRLLTLCSL